VYTTGDTYVVVSGIPEPQPDHAVRMTKFAQECLTTFNSLTRELEKQLGPQTADLKMRIGLSSGPVVGGVLLGGDSKFHIFGKYHELVIGGRYVDGESSSSHTDLFLRRNHCQYGRPNGRHG